MSDEIRDHGKIVTAPAGTSEQEIQDKLTGADRLPPIGQELGRAPEKPVFDPHAGREVEHGREHGDEPEHQISTIVLMGVDWGGDFEDYINRVVEFAQKIGLHYVTATVGVFDIDQHADDLTSMVNEATVESDE